MWTKFSGDWPKAATCVASQTNKQTDRQTDRQTVKRTLANHETNILAKMKFWKVINILYVEGHHPFSFPAGGPDSVLCIHFEIGNHRMIVEKNYIDDQI